MFFFSKRNRIIKKAVAKTVREYGDRTPRIYQHFFYGAVDMAPQNLVVWYLFETDSELKTAETSGVCNELQKMTVKNLLLLGYPEEAFERSHADTPANKFMIQAETKEDIQAFPYSLNNKKVMISFTTKEDIDKKADGDYRLYFQ